MTYRVIPGDCKEEIRKLIAEGIQVDSIVTDPPYELGFMGKSWDSTGIANDIELWKLALQILKPGGHLLAFGATRTYHRLACAIEDAGFEIRDSIRYLQEMHYPAYVYGQGFPKSLNISKAIDKMAGKEREVVGAGQYSDKKPNGSAGVNSVGLNNTPGYLETKPATDLAKQWDGWGSGLKPAFEPIVMARKPLSEKNIASNVIKHGTGGINIDGCRVGTSENLNGGAYSSGKSVAMFSPGNGGGFVRQEGLYKQPSGRFPANLIHDGSEEVETEFAKYGERISGKLKEGQCKNGKTSQFIYGKFNGWNSPEYKPDKGSASRFFYSAKASKKDRQGSKHPTVKPISLMRYLCRLVTPKEGTVLDMFAGTGTTGQAALEEGFNCILIEKEAEYINDINRRLDNIALPLWKVNIKEKENEKQR